jgi:mannonate dehydratase
MRIGHFSLSSRFDDAVAAAQELHYLRQIGVDDIVLVEQPRELCDQLELVRIRNICENAGLRLLAVENIAPQHEVLEPIILGRDDRNLAIAVVQDAIRSMGRSGIPFYGLHWHIPPVPLRGNGVIRTSWTIPWRGDALVTGFDLGDLDELPLYRERIFDEHEIWDNFSYFMQSVLPVAEESGVTLSLHPHDPPIRTPLGGIPRIFTCLSDFERVDSIAPNARIGLTLCLGNWQLMGRDDLFGAIERFGSRGRVSYVHVQAVRGTPERFHECFVDEGDCDLAEVVRALAATGFAGTLVPAHVPVLDGDGASVTGADRATAYTVGYVRALIQGALTYEPSPG